MFVIPGEMAIASRSGMPGDIGPGFPPAVGGMTQWDAHFLETAISGIQFEEESDGV